MRRLFRRLRQAVSGSGRLVLLLAGLLVFIAVFILVSTELGANLFEEYINVGLMLWLSLFFMFVMLVTGIWKDFVNGFRLVFAERENVTRMELQMAAKAVGAAGRLVVLESVMAVALYMVDLLYCMSFSLDLLGPLLSLILLCIAYTCVFSILTIPIRVKLENMVISYMEETGEEQVKEGAQDDSQTVYFRLRGMGLTDREAEVARLVCCGLANKEIGQILYISDTTVKKHMTHILEKTKCDSREELTELVLKQDLRKHRQSGVVSDSVRD